MGTLHRLSKERGLDPGGELETGVGGNLPGQGRGRFQVCLTATALESEPLASFSQDEINDALEAFSKLLIAEEGHADESLRDSGFQLVETSPRNRLWRRTLSWPESRILTPHLERGTLRITGVSIAGWRSFDGRQQVPIDRLALLIGPNNAGKTNVLDAISTLGLYVKKPDLVLRENQIANLRGDSRAALGLSFEFRGTAGHFEASWTRDGDLLEWLNAGTQVYYRKGNLIKTDGGEDMIGNASSGLAWMGQRIAADGSTAATVVKHLQDTIGAYAVSRLVPERFDVPAQVARHAATGPDGSGAAAVLDHLRDKYPSAFDALQHDFRRCAPEIKRVVAEASENPGKKEIYFYGTDGTVVRSRQVSEGLKFLLFVLLIVHSPSPRRLSALEEIESGLHPARMADIVGFLRRLTDAALGPQLLVTSHSPIVLDQFRETPEDVLVVERDDTGATTCTPLESRLDALPDSGTSLGDLWYTGVLGGVPNQ